MSQKNHRIGRIERSLTPGQAVLLWMEDAHQFESLQAYLTAAQIRPLNL